MRPEEGREGTRLRSWRSCRQAAEDPPLTGSPPCRQAVFVPLPSAAAVAESTSAHSVQGYKRLSVMCLICCSSVAAVSDLQTCRNSSQGLTGFIRTWRAATLRDGISRADLGIRDGCFNSCATVARFGYCSRTNTVLDPADQRFNDLKISIRASYGINRSGGTGDPSRSKPSSLTCF